MTRLPKYLDSSQGSLWLTEDEKENLKLSYRIKEVLFEETSPYQHVMVLDSYDFGRMLVLDGIVQTTTLDGFIYNEMITHMPLSVHPAPRHVLIIGGGDCGAAQEAVKYDSVEQIDLVEIDEAVVRACKQYMPEISGGPDSDARIHFHYCDGVKFAKSERNKYDIVIVDSSDPIGPAVQLFETGFYQSLFDILKEDGLMVCQSQSPIFHRDVTAQSYKRIRGLFPHVRMYTAVVPTYPGGLWSFTIGSKREIPAPEQIRFDKPAKYVNERVLQSAFALPVFVEQLLE